MCDRITQLKSELENPLLEMEVIEEQLTDLYQQEITFREKSKTVDGPKVFCEVDSVELKNYEAKINKYLRQQRKIEKEHKDAFKRLEKYLKKEKRIRDKDKVYRIDTEPDQIMTCFKMPFVNLCSPFLARCMGHEKFEMRTLFEPIFQLNGESFIANGEKKIEL